MSSCEPRAVLLPDELTRYSELGEDAARALTGVLTTVNPGDTERSVAASTAQALVAVGADPLVVLVAGRKRLGYRHPLPGSGPIGDLAMTVVCARRHGLIANLTRWVGFGPRRADEIDARRRILEVEADFFAETRPGRQLGDVFASAVAAYGHQGFSADEYTKHHQGGPTGYVGRDPRANFGLTDLVREGQAFAWNPSAPLTKVEDTIVVGVTLPVVLTVDPAWPTIDVRGLQRPDVFWR